MRILSEEENPLLKQRRVRFEVDHPQAPTPSRLEVLEELSSSLDVPEDRIVIEKISTPYGSQVALGVASVYDSKASLEKVGSKHLIERDRASETEAEKEEVEEVPEEGAEEAGEEVKEGEVPERGPESEEEKSEETPEEDKERERSESEEKSEETVEKGGM